MRVEEGEHEAVLIRLAFAAAVEIPSFGQRRSGPRAVPARSGHLRMRSLLRFLTITAPLKHQPSVGHNSCNSGLFL